MSRSRHVRVDYRISGVTMRVVITHDFFETFGGAERVTAEIAAAFPDAEVFAILGRRAVARRMGIADRVTTVLPQQSQLLAHYRMLAPMYPALVRAAKLPEADLLIASSYAYAHGFRTPNRAPVLCYSHGPFRHLWSQHEVYASHHVRTRAARTMFDVYARGARVADRAAAASVSHFLTQSPYTSRLILRAYGRVSQILPPPVDCSRFRPSGAASQGYYLFVGRLVEAYKRPSLVLDAFARMPGRRLLIAGDGPELAALRRRATPNVEFLGRLEDDALVEAMQGCEAALFPSVDDFGLVPIEVNACGRPVLALRAGGALYTVKPGLSGEFFEDASVASIVSAVQAFEARSYDPQAIRRHALRFGPGEFRRGIRAAAEWLTGEAPTVEPPPAPAREAPADVPLVTVG
jgi:glycosyltransferase involved in cell wall biosynthesis